MTPQLRHAYYGSRPEKFMHIRACTKLSANFYQPGVYGSAITVWATAVPMFFDTGITGGIGQSAKGSGQYMTERRCSKASWNGSAAKLLIPIGSLPFRSERLAKNDPFARINRGAL